MCLNVVPVTTDQYINSLLQLVGSCSFSCDLDLIESKRLNFYRLKADLNYFATDRKQS